MKISANTTTPIICLRRLTGVGYSGWNAWNTARIIGTATSGIQLPEYISLG